MWHDMGLAISHGTGRPSSTRQLVLSRLGTNPDLARALVLDVGCGVNDPIARNP